MFDPSFYKEKKVFITGHTGFKGTWMCEELLEMGAEVTGYALEPPTSPSLYNLCNLQRRINSVVGDVRDLDSLQKAMDEAKPEIVIHMAAQPIVRESYKSPVYTYETNVMGTVNLLEAVRKCPSVRSLVNVTTDKVYLNREWEWGYRETDELNGYDPYSNSKSCSELVTSSYKNAFFGGEKGKNEDGRVIAISTCRAGNVIGGGDFAADRIIPDCVRALENGKEIIIRNPYSVRPYQHVLEPVTAYLWLAAEQYNDTNYAGSYNIGPDDKDCLTTGNLVDLFCNKWNTKANDFGLPKASWINKSDGGPHEANFLKLDCSKIKKRLGWKPIWDIEDAIDRIVDFNMVYLSKQDVTEMTKKQVRLYLQSFS
ncbi:MAG: CDP-glucose 4,6-dehydratase [Lachnospiraceae bacterium]|nr:CDP-glucose 4,6-dehydratase [Lachnospiraceae bacterium]